jgi:hypothetical protein
MEELCDGESGNMFRDFGKEDLQQIIEFGFGFAKMEMKWDDGI